MELPIILQKDHINEFTLAFPLCVLKSNSVVLPWIYENFVNIFINEVDKIYYDGFSSFFPGAFEDIIRFSELTYAMCADQTNICEYIKRQIAGSYYCYIHLDEYYLSERTGHLKSHFRHESLIYGFDDDKCEFMAIAFNKSKIFSKLRYPYGEVAQAYESVKEIYNQPHEQSMIFFKTWEQISSYYEFSLSRFLKRLISYVNGDKSVNYLQENLEHNRYVIFGFNVYEKILSIINDETVISGSREENNYEKIDPDSPIYDSRNMRRINNNLNFKVFNFLYEHKNGLLKRFEHINEFHIDDGSFTQYVEKFKSVVNGFALIRNLALKNENTEDFEKRVNINKKISAHIKQYSQDEYEQLSEIIQYLTNKLHNKSDRYNRIKTLPDAYIISDNEKISNNQYHSKIVYIWTDEKYIEYIMIEKRSQIGVAVDGKKIYKRSLYETNRELQRIDINDKTKNITIDIYSDFHIEINKLNIEIYEHIVDIALKKDITASSTWGSDTGNIDISVLAKNAVDGNEYTHWNAQRYFKGNEYLEIDFGEITTLNCVVLKERKGNSRIRKYRLEGIDENNGRFEILAHEGMLKEHRFDEIKAKGIRLTIIETQIDENNFNDPNISQFSVYHLKNL